MPPSFSTLQLRRSNGREPTPPARRPSPHPGSGVPPPLPDPPPNGRTASTTRVGESWQSRRRSAWVGRRIVKALLRTPAPTVALKAHEALTCPNSSFRTALHANRPRFPAKVCRPSLSTLGPGCAARDRAAIARGMPAPVSGRTCFIHDHLPARSPPRGNADPVLDAAAAKAADAKCPSRRLPGSCSCGQHAALTHSWSMRPLLAPLRLGV